MFGNPLIIPSFSPSLSLSFVFSPSPQWIAGFVVFFYPGSPPVSRQAFLPWHTFLGAFVFLLALATSTQGILEKMVFRQTAAGVDKRSAEALVANALGLAIFLWGAVVLWAGSTIDRTRQEEGYRVLG